MTYLLNQLSKHTQHEVAPLIQVSRVLPQEFDFHWQTTSNNAEVRKLLRDTGSFFYFYFFTFFNNSAMCATFPVIADPSVGLEKTNYHVPPFLHMSPAICSTDRSFTELERWVQLPEHDALPAFNTQMLRRHSCQELNWFPPVVGKCFMSEYFYLCISVACVLTDAQQESAVEKCLSSNILLLSGYNAHREHACNYEINVNAWHADNDNKYSPSSQSADTLIHLSTFQLIWR